MLQETCVLLYRTAIKKITKEKTKETTTEERVEPVVPKKPPSIMADKIKPKEFYAALAEKGVTVNYKKAGNRIATKCRSSEDHTTVMELLRTEELGGHSYTPKDFKKTVMLMKDVHYTIPIEDNKTAIKEQTGLEVEAKRLETPRSKNKGVHPGHSHGDDRGEKRQGTHENKAR